MSRENPVVINLSLLPKKLTRIPFEPKWASTSPEIEFVRGSTIRTFLSLQPVAKTRPSNDQAADWMISVWPSTLKIQSPFSISQIRKVKSVEVVAKTLFAIGWKLTVPTLRLWPDKTWTASVELLFKPPCGICQILA